jgi:hypothetical protein
VKKTSKMAFGRALRSGYIKKTQLEVFKAYCDAYNELKWANKEGITANEIQWFIKRYKHPAKSLFDSDKLNHANKLQAPLRAKGFLQLSGERICKVKGTLAQFDKLTYGNGNKALKKQSFKALCENILSAYDNKDFDSVDSIVGDIRDRLNEGIF